MRFLLGVVDGTGQPYHYRLSKTVTAADSRSIHAYCNKQGKTIVLTSHNPNHCFCIPTAKVCMIEAGTIQAFGTPK